jgi:hypothetical protein
MAFTFQYIMYISICVALLVALLVCCWLGEMISLYTCIKAKK